MATDGSVDTGATAIISAAELAHRTRLQGGQAAGVTAAGVVPAWRVAFNAVKVGGITLNQVDGLVEAGRMCRCWG
jgi:aspartyl protease family protein